MNTRRQDAQTVRNNAATLAERRPHPRHIDNGDEHKFRRDIEVDGRTVNKPSYLASYTKGLPHNKTTGLIANPDDFQKFVRGIDSGEPRDFRDTPLGPPNMPWESEKAEQANAQVRAWESAGAGHTFDLEGPDAQAVTMPPAPAIGSPELSAEMAEVYAQALLRDIPFTAMAKGTTVDASHQNRVDEVIAILNCLPWFKGDPLDLSTQEVSRRRTGLKIGTAFRGITPGDTVGPHISQFLLAGNRGINGNDNERSPADGFVSYGAVSIDQRVRHAVACDDHMTTWNEWLDVQNGADLRGLESYEPKNAASGKPPRRFITTPRDLATYVHYDALYEAYLNACLIMLGIGIPFDPGIPFQQDDIIDHQQGFAHFGGPHILSLVTEVATRALKAVRFQKFNVHRRLRPEALAGRVEKADMLDSSAPELATLKDDLEISGILSEVKTHNENINGAGNGTHLLPMAFCEGSPMHPSYGAGHATVAGACVTILKAFFDHKHPLNIVLNEDASSAYVPNATGEALEVVPVLDADGQPGRLTVEGELNKLASNIAIGRDWAGVHYFTDYIESIRMGEEIAIGILEEQRLTYGENMSMTVPLFDGGSIRI